MTDSRLASVIENRRALEQKSESNPIPSRRRHVASRDAPAMPLDAETLEPAFADDASRTRRRPATPPRGASAASIAATPRRRAETTARKGGGEATARRAIDAACQRATSSTRRGTAFEATREGRERYALAPHSCNVLLHMCAGGAGAWTAGLAHEECARAKEADEVVKYMEARRVMMSEMSYTALARVRAATGDVEGALDAARALKEEKLTPKVRTYACALHASAKKGDLEKMEAVEAMMRDEGLLPTELEFAAMLRAYRAAEAFDGGFAMLRRMRTEIRSPSDEMSEELRAWFSAVPGWSVADEVRVDDAGAAVAVLAMEEKRVELQLKAISLTEEERADLLAGIAKLACEREAQSEFDNFMNWLDVKKDGMNAIVDGANVGMYNQNFSTSGMNFNQVEKVLVELRKRAKEGDAPPIAFLHQRRVEGGPARKPHNQALLAKWDGAGELFTTAHGSNDDWYWLYAAVHAGDEAFLVTNDECRDHVFPNAPIAQALLPMERASSSSFQHHRGRSRVGLPRLVHDVHARSRRRFLVDVPSGRRELVVRVQSRIDIHSVRLIQDVLLSET